MLSISETWILEPHDAHGKTHSSVIQPPYATIFTAKYYRVVSVAVLYLQLAVLFRTFLRITLSETLKYLHSIGIYRYFTYTKSLHYFSRQRKTHSRVFTRKQTLSTSVCVEEFFHARDVPIWIKKNKFGLICFTIFLEFFNIYVRINPPNIISWFCWADTLS